MRTWIFIGSVEDGTARSLERQDAVALDDPGCELAHRRLLGALEMRLVLVDPAPRHAGAAALHDDALLDELLEHLDQVLVVGHIPGALSVPLPELAKRLAAPPRRREVVAYCRGPYCVLAVEAVKLLRARGFKAVRLEDGVLDWASHGLKLAGSDR